MSATGVAAFDATLQTTHVWLYELCEELHWKRDLHRAYHALRAVLHALRDRLHPEEVAGIAAQLPLLIRGTFYEGWHPAGKPLGSPMVEEFLAPVADAFRGDPPSRPAEIARAVFALLRRHITPGELKDVVGVLPAEVQQLWEPSPTEPHVQDPLR